MLKKQYLLWLLFSLFVSLVWTALLLVGGLAVRFFGIAVRAFNTVSYTHLTLPTKA